MFDPRRPVICGACGPRRGGPHPAIAMGLVVALLAVAGCASLEGARLYRSGSDALDRGDVEAAVADLERAAELVPQASEVQNHLGLARLAAGDEALARVAFERAVALDCDNEAAITNLAALEGGAAAVRPSAATGGSGSQGVLGGGGGP